MLRDWPLANEIYQSAGGTDELRAGLVLLPGRRLSQGIPLGGPPAEDSTG